MIQTSFVANEDMYNMAKSLEQLRQYDDVKLSTLYKEALNRNLSKSELANYHQAVYERFRDLLHYVAEMLCKRYKLLRTGEDIINEVFLKLFEGKWTKTFNSGESLKYYLLKSVRNLTLDYCRKKGRESRALEDSFHELSSAVSSISIPDKELIPERLQELLQELEPDERELLLFRFVGFSYDEISQREGGSSSSEALRKKFSRVIQKLRERLVS